MECSEIGRYGPFNSVLDAVYSELIQCVREYNAARCLALRLPPELLHAILDLLSFKERMTAARVCQAWKDVAYICPVPAFPIWDDASALAVHLRHLPRAPLCLAVRIKLSTAALCDFLREQMWRIQDLHLALEYDALDSDHGPRDALFTALRMPATKLRRLTIVGPYILPLQALGDSWFSGSAPNLSHCCFEGTVFTAPIFRATRTLHLHIDQDDKLVELLRPALEQYSHLQNLNISGSSSDRTTQPLPMPPHMRRLWLQDPATLLDCVDHARLSHVYIAYNSDGNHLDDALAADMHRSCAAPTAQVDLSLFWPREMYGSIPLLAVRVLDTNARCRVFTSSSSGPLRLPDDFFAHVTSLSLDATDTLEPLQLPELPALRRLTLICHPALDRHHCTPPVLQRLQCPPLAELVVNGPARYARQVPWSLRAVEVLELVAQGVETLSFRSVQLVAPGVDDLRARVSHLNIDTSAPPPEAWVDTISFQPVWGPAVE